MTTLRRYAPFALLVAAQIVLVLVAPSRGATPANGPLGGEFPGAAATPGPTSSLPGGGPTPLPGASSAPGVTAGGGATTGPAPAGGTGTTTAGGRAVAAPATGQTTSKPFCVTGLNDHPPCIARWAGGDNGGATWQGVTGDSITVVMYRPKDNAAVDAILRETGTYTPPDVEQEMFQVVVKWINEHYQLYGRRIHPVYVHGNCDIAPPRDDCFRSDADRIVADHKPFAVFWDSDTNEPAFFDELARKGVVSWGGWAFSDAFNNALRPYHYDVFMGGDVQADFAGTWYCNRLAGHPARYAGSATLRAKTRKAVVIYPDTAQTTPSAQRLIGIIKRCAGSDAVIDGRYSSDTSTAAQQATTNAAKYKAAGVTTSIWFSDPIAPAYGTKADTAQNYFPEHVLAGSGLLDYDALAQTYDERQWAHAFGPSDLGQTVNIDQTNAGKIWRAEGRKGSANANSNLLTSYALLLSQGIMAAGPKLTPLTYEYGMLTAPGYNQWAKWHDPQLTYLKWGRGDYTGVSDIREVRYSTTKRSPVNGRNGTYIPLNGGRRYQLDQLPRGELRL